jgi:hypothetical protein
MTMDDLDQFMFVILTWSCIALAALGVYHVFEVILGKKKE